MPAKGLYCRYSKKYSIRIITATTNLPNSPLLQWQSKVADSLISNIYIYIYIHRGEQFIIYYNANCKTENIIYLLECAMYGLQYIGKTKQQLSERLNGHRSDANCKPDLPLSRHLRSTGHHDSFRN
jgi:hypothetical protein